MIDTRQVVATYYEILTAGLAAYGDGGRLRAILAPDLVFEGPIAGRRVGAEAFLKGVAGFIGTVRRLDLVHEVHAGNLVATLYDAELPGGTVRFAEFLDIAEGRIRSLRLLYDATEYRARGGR